MSFGPRTLIAESFQEVEVKSLKGLASNEAEDVSGRTSAEIERVIYVRVKDFAWLERATGAERQEQWSVKIAKTDKNAGSGSIRVRKSINLREPGAAVSYVLTSKLDIGERGSCAETPEQSSLDQFNIFKYFGDAGMIKDRYTFPIEGSDLNWEVDCFPKPGAQYHDWVKIDLESWPRGKELPALPMEFTEMLDGSEGLQSPESEEKIKQMYETMFLTPNTNQPLADYGNSDAPPAGGATDEDGEQKQNDNPDGGTPAADDGSGDNGGGDGAGGDDQNAGGDDSGGGDNAAGSDDNASGDDDQGDGKDDLQKEVKQDTDDLAKATTENFKPYMSSNEEFSSAGQVLVPLIPILGPLLTIIHGNRGKDFGLFTTRQHTTKTTSHIGSDGHKSSHKQETGSFSLADLADAKDYIGMIEGAVHEVSRNQKNVERIDMTLWPQKDGRHGMLNIKTDRNGETRLFVENNPGKLKWFDLSLAGKRKIILIGDDVKKFKFNGRTIQCPFNGQIVEFDVGQLRKLEYQTIPSGKGFDITEFNFDD
ncbi:hypothetical protein [Burkholderia phage FLC6]|nr:hypothetical protein [Burkholderia phage FLC6]BDD79374.1 hypothetical protein [Burkholderia phage FLC8]